MKKLSVVMVSVLMMLSMVFSTGVFAANEETTAATPTGVEYRGHVQNKGDVPADDATWITGPTQLGTVGEGLRLEAFWIRLTDAPAGLHIKYEVHVQNKGWMDPVEDGVMAGTRSEGLRIEAIKISLVDDQGNVAEGYSVQYKGHVENIGDVPVNDPEYTGTTGWYADGDQLGTTGSSLRLEALEIQIVQTQVQTDLTAYNAALAAVTEADYTVASWTAYQEVVAANVVTAENTQAEVDAATASIVAAQANLVTKADLTAYNTALAAVTEADYTAASWTAYQAIVAANVVTAENTQAEVDAATASIVAAQENLVPVGDLPAATVNFYSSLVPGMKIVLVTLDTETPLDYTVTYDGIALTYDPVFEGFKADVSTTVVETLTPVVEKIAPPVMPTATVNFYSSLVPGMKIVLVKLDTETPTAYAVTYDGVELTYDLVFEGFKGDVSTTVVETLTPVVTLV